MTILLSNCNNWKTTDDVDILSEEKSPDGRHVATVFNCSGGGAAGYHYANVNLRNSKEELNQRKVLLGSYLWPSFKDMSVAWEDATTLVVTYSWNTRNPESRKKEEKRVRKQGDVTVKYVEK